jgi:hypothetical protein
MFWVLQDRFFDPHAFAELRRHLDAQAAPHAVVRVNARTLEIDPAADPVGAVFVCGSSTLGRVAKARGWWPGYVDDDLDYRLLARHYGEHLLNADARCVPLDGAPAPAGPVFVRPVGDGKQFSGSVKSAGEFVAWRRTLLDELARGAHPRLRASEPIVIAMPKVLHAEFRLRVVDGAIVSASTYRRGGAPFLSDQVDERVLEFARARIAQWSPNRAFCLDVADTPDGLKVVEINAIGSSAFYAGDIGRFVAAIEAMVPHAA